MFEGALVESRGQLGSPAVRWTAAGSVVVQGAFAALLVALPILRPESLQMLAKAPALISPAVPKPPVAVRVKVPEVQTAASAVSVPAVVERVESGPRAFRPIVPGPLSADDPGMAGPVAMTMGGGPGTGLGVMGPGVGSGTAVVRAVPSGPVRVSSGVSSGMLLSAIQPVYPAIAKAARVQGTVVVEAVISKAGRIESARAVSGPEMLKQAAVDAVSGARCRPYALNGQAVEVQTSVTVNFHIAE